MIKSIGTAIDSPTIATGFLAQLLDDARVRGARMAVTVLASSPVLIPRLAPLGSVYLPPAALREDCDEAMAFTLEALGGSARDLAVQGVYGDLAGLAGQIGRTGEIVDLFVVGPRSTWDIPWLHRQVIESLLLGSGTPVMILPEDRRLPAFERIVVGWQHKGEAVRVARDLVALAAPGATIEIVTVGASPEESPERKDGHHAIAAFLSRHGFVTRSNWIEDTGPDAELLQDFARDVAADLLAVGGFGHSRLREIILGGVTRDLVDEPRMPVLMSH